MEKMIRVVAKCPDCKVVDEFEIPEAGLMLRSSGKTLAEAFPDLPEERRAQLATNKCPGCQKKPQG